MKTKLLLIGFLLYSILSISQIIYSDEFDENINNATSSSALSTSINNANLRIVGDGTGGAWENIAYYFHNNGNNININASSNPKLYVKVKAENSPEIRMDFIDINGYVTNLNPSSISPSTSYQIFEIDYTGKFIDGGYGGSCDPGPCNVDSAQLTGIMFFLNPGTGGYNGTIDIEWLSVGESLETIPDYEIRYNQIGYFVDRDKVISIASPNSFTPKAYTIFDANDNVVLSGTSATVNHWADANEYVSQVDITSINSSGTYKFQTDELEIYFNVDSDIYESIAEASLKYYYYNRASTAISATYGGVYARNFGHPDTQVYVHSSAASPTRPTGTIISSPKGWYDAGDYNKYIVNSGISTYTLLAAFEHYQSYYQSKTINIPETGGNLPDILDEVKWNLDWMLTMQEPSDGGVYHKLTGLNFSGDVMPENYTFNRYVVQKSTAAALNFAAVMAVASRIYSNYNTQLPGYSATLLSAAQAAYTWAKANPTVYFTNPSDVNTGEYGDSDVSDEFQWAAVELFITTGNTQYNNDINVSSLANDIPSWIDVDPLALISITYHESTLSSDINTNLARNLLLATANSLKTEIQNSVMDIAMGEGTWDYIWGSNSVAGNQIILLIRAYEITNDGTFLNAAYTAMDYLLGRNGTGYCYVTGFGDKSPLNPHHRVSESDTVTQPIPGMLVGGPNPGQQDGCSYTNDTNAGSYIDEWCSFASNEVTINWNAPFAYAINALQYYQDEGEALSIDNVSENEQSILLYPNPTEGILNIKSTQQINLVTVYNSLGKILLKTKTTSLDLRALPSGFYILKINTEKNQIITRKLLKK